MKNTNKILLVILFNIVLIPAFSQRQSLRFNNDGNFKIVQFTDVHYKPGNQASDVAVQLIKEVLDVEKPDLVVFTGDIVWARPAREALDAVLTPVVDSNVPWVYVFGNHDDEFDMTRDEIMEYIMKKPYCLAQPGDKSIKGVGNYVLEIKDNTDKVIKSVLYFMDSGSYSPLKEIGGYDWFHFNQIDWYRKQSAAYTKMNEGEPYPALAFFHIPLFEYVLMKADEKAIVIGNKDEKECNGRLNTGMFAAMREAGDVMGTIVGHDHNNDYIGVYQNIALSYGRYSGGKTVYNDLGLNGCRVIELTQDKREFSTYVRLLGGEKLFSVKYPDTFIVPKEEKK